MTELKVGQAVYSRCCGQVFFITAIEQRETTWYYQIDGDVWFTSPQMAYMFDVQFNELLA